ncbi:MULTISPECIES: hypothetical protein [Rhizobium]|uniref:Tail fiber protein n=1 Tax=Rhizobium tropici TaxID=398 RepID=A0A6P1C801_RHITR|nr:MULTISPECIES: hypothetical protein [Rhizobium]AGB71044.1 side tail fiber protein [Rhizobium tropici CIAT 899]MBB4242362.1 hypothetical protein [Rhizobium tropici]MBB5594005.1 hypothetical protein [Rhizobium tropici]MBB6492874.1 hypothetical protein [Rhizobium tropici]NEV13339.1 hypothetical protein [Rhizobium tropici]
MSDVDVTIIAKERIVVVEAVENLIEVAQPGPQGPAGPQGDPGPPGPSGASSWSDITNKPSTLAGYGITDAATAAQGAKADSALQSGASSDLIAEGGGHLFFSSSRVLGVVLSGLSSATNAAITASDTVLSAFGKLQAQINGLASSKLDTTATAAAATKLVTARTINGVSFDGTANITVADGTKEPGIAAGTTAQYWRGDKSWQDLAASVRAIVLTGLSTATSTAIAATDSVLSALGKLQAQVSSLSTSKLDVSATAAAATKLVTARTINGVSFDGTANITVSDSSKEPSIASGTAAQFWRGDKTWQDFATVTRAVALTGLSTATNAAIAATDSILVGFGKLQAQINGLAPTNSPTLTGTPTAPTPASTDSGTTIATTAFVKSMYPSAAVVPASGFTLGASPDAGRAKKTGPIVHLDGWLLKTGGGAMAANTKIGNVPSGYAPLGNLLCNLLVSDGAGSYQLIAAGITPATDSDPGKIFTTQAATVSSVISLQNITYDTNFA